MPSGYDPAPRAFVPRTTEPDPAERAAPNRLPDPPAPTAPNQAWVGRARWGDVAYLPKPGGGWPYLATWLDRCARKVVGGDLRGARPGDLVSEALAVPWPYAGPRVHSDQGRHCTAARFKDLLARHEAQQSRSRRRNCCHLASYSAERRRSARAQPLRNPLSNHVPVLSTSIRPPQCEVV